MKETLKHFDLRFLGGTPANFIEAINKQAGMKVNVIIPPEYADEQLPPLEVFDVTLPKLFFARIAASTIETNIATARDFGGPNRPSINQYTRAIQSKGFKTTDALPSEPSIWFFYVDRPSAPPVSDNPEPVSVQVYQLSNLLTAYSIEDITTAIKTTWEMMDSKTKPEMKFHAETKLLVAKGTEEQLRMIETVTEQLGRGMTSGQQPSRGTRTSPLGALPPTQLTPPNP